MSKTPEETADFLFPLTRRQTRTERVTAELADLSRLPRRRVLTQAQETHKDRRLASETLIAVVRGFLRAGDENAANTALEALIERLRPAVRARAQRWSALFPADVSNAEDDAILKLVGYLRSTDSGQEFWECNFIHCFNKRLDDLFRQIAGQRKETLSLTSKWADGDERDHLDETPDAASESAFAAIFDDIVTQETIQALSREIPRLTEYLFLHTQGYTDKEIAVKMGVTDRTLRNWKDRAKIVLTTLRTRP